MPCRGKHAAILIVRTTPRASSPRRAGEAFDPFNQADLHWLCRSLVYAAGRENSGKARAFSYCYELPIVLRLESAADTHTAADLRVRRQVPNRADPVSRDVANGLRNTSGLSARNGID